MGDMVQWPIYLTIENLSYEIKRSLIRPRGQIIDVITQGMFKSFFSCIVVKPGIALEKVMVKGLLMICTDRNI